MAWEFDNKTPIFAQIIDAITLRIIKGDYKMGEKLDSVRDLAVCAGVNPNTMQRALSQIEETGLVETKRGDGRYITENPKIIEDLRQNYIKKNALDFLTVMKDLGFEKSQIVDIVEKTNI